MEKLLALLDLQDKDSLEKLLEMGLAKGEHALETKLGIDIPDAVPGQVAKGIVALLESATALKAARVEGLKAAEAVKTPPDADSVIGTTPGGGIVSGLVALMLVSVCLIANPVMAQTPAPSDAPIAAADEIAAIPTVPVVTATPVIDRSAELVPLTTGQPAPFDGRLYSNKLHVDVAKRIVNCETTLKAVEPKVGMPTWQVVLIALGAAAVATSIAVPVTVAATRPK